MDHYHSNVFEKIVEGEGLMIAIVVGPNST